MKLRQCMASAIALKGAVFLEISFVCKCSSSFKVGCFFQSSIFQNSAVFRNAKVRPLKTFCVVLNKKKYVIYQCKFGTPNQHKILGNVDFQFLRLGPVKGKVVSLLGHFFLTAKFTPPIRLVRFWEILRWLEIIRFIKFNFRIYASMTPI